ncbi:unnamed protein product [Protopolystoma xenopodis]|uniref:Uncharacterized protein n=1 Tax=Protopolystoma xenopodis TaxID=117903 RepID=A0A3S5CKU9_9PLAT|nr:unnamed protein product [Protopolystoma xenopodis]
MIIDKIDIYACLLRICLFLSIKIPPTHQRVILIRKTSELIHRILSRRQVFQGRVLIVLTVRPEVDPSGAEAVLAIQLIWQARTKAHRLLDRVESLADKEDGPLVINEGDSRKRKRRSCESGRINNGLSKDTKFATSRWDTKFIILI